MGFLTPVIGIEDADGDRIDPVRPDGTRSPIIQQYGEGFTHTTEVDGGVARVRTSIDPAFIADAAEGAGSAVATIAQLRAIPEADRQDGQARTVKADFSGVPFTAIFKSTGGTGLADDGRSIFIPNDKTIGDPDRWWRDPPEATTTRAGMITVADMQRLRGGLGGTLHAAALAPSDVGDISNVVEIFDTITVNLNDRVLLPNQTDKTENGLYYVVSKGGGFVALARAPEFDDSTDIVHGTTITVAQGDPTTGENNAGSEWRLDTTGPVTVGATQLNFSRLPDSLDRERLDTIFRFNGVPIEPGSSKAAEINSVLGDGFDPVLQDGGDYGIETAIIVPKGRSITCVGRARIYPEFTPSAGQADVRTNAMLFVESAFNTAKLNTTLTTAITPGGVTYFGANARKISVNSLGAPIVANEYFAIGGHNTCLGEVPGGSNGDSVTSCEVCQVSATQTGPNRITPKWPTLQYHDTTNGGVGEALYVKGIDANVDVTIRGIHFDASGGTVAVGICATRAIRLNIEDCVVEGFSRAGVDMFGCLDVDITRLFNAGECSCGVLNTTSHNVTVEEYITADDGLRAHANGLRRASIFAEYNPINFRVNGFAIRHAVQGISIRGGNCDISNGIISDCDIRSQVIDSTHGNLRGVGICTGNGEGVYDEYTKSVNVTDVTITNARSAAASEIVDDQIEFSILFHDCHQSRATRVHVINKGLNVSTVLDGDGDYQMFGIGFQDTYAEISQCVVKGVQFGFAIRYSLGVKISDCSYVAAPGVAGPPPTIGLWLKSGGPSIEIRDLDIGGGTYVWFTTDYGTVYPYLPFFTGKFRLNDEEVVGPLVVGYNNTGATPAQGDVVAADTASASGERKVINPASGSTQLFANVGTVNGNWLLLKPLDNDVSSVRVNGATSLGQYLEWVAGSRVLIPASPNVPTVRTVGTALEVKGAGTALMQMGPVPRMGDATADNDSIAARGSAGEMVASTFRTTGTIADAGLVRGPKGNKVIVLRNAADSGNLVALSTESANDSVNIGEDETGTISATYAKIGAGTFVSIETGNTTYMQVGGSIKITLTSSSFDSAVDIKADALDEHTASAGIKLKASKVGFFNGTPATKPTVTGIRHGNTALGDLLSDLAGLGLITDSTTEGGDLATQFMSIYVDDTAAATPVAERPIGMPHLAVTVRSAFFENDAGITGDNTNNATFKVWRRNGSGTQAAIASLQTLTGTDLTAWVAKNLGSLTNTTIAADEAVTVEVTKDGTGARVKGTFTIGYTLD